MLFVSAQRQVAPTKSLNMNKSFDHVDGEYAEVNGINIYYEEYGAYEQRETMLIIHGNGGSSQTVSAQIQFFSKRFHVIVADSRGQGKTNNTADSLTYEIMAKDMKLLLDDFELDSVYILGIGDGGIIGLMMAIYYPEKVKKLAAVGAHLLSDTTAFEQATIDMNMQRRSMAMDSIRAGNEQFKAELQLTQLLLNHPHIEIEELQEISIPVLIMSGDRDMIRLEHTLIIFQNIANAELSIVPGTTRDAASESPQIFNNHIQRFFMKKKSVPEDVPPGDE